MAACHIAAVRWGFCVLLHNAQNHSSTAIILLALQFLFYKANYALIGAETNAHFEICIKCEYRDVCKLSNISAAQAVAKTI